MQHLGAGCWVLGAGCWVPGAWCWVLGAGCWVEVERRATSPAGSVAAGGVARAPPSVSMPPSRPRAGSPAAPLSTQHPALSTQHPALSTQHPAPSTQHSALSTTQHPPGTSLALTPRSAMTDD